MNRGKPTGLFDISRRELHIGDLVASMFSSENTPVLGVVAKFSATKVAIARIRNQYLRDGAWLTYGQDATRHGVHHAPRSSEPAYLLIINQDTFDMPFIKRTVDMALENQ